MLERDIIIAIKIYLASLGSDVFFWKEHGGPYGTSGIPDIICCYKGRFLGLEAKLPGGKLTALQRRALEKINAAGGIGRRVESVDDVKAVIAQADADATGGRWLAHIVRGSNSTRTTRWSSHRAGGLGRGRWKPAVSRRW